MAAVWKSEARPGRAGVGQEQTAEVLTQSGHSYGARTTFSLPALSSADTLYLPVILFICSSLVARAYITWLNLLKRVFLFG